MLILYCYRPLVGVKDAAIDQTLCFADDLQSFALFFVRKYSTKRVLQ